MSNFLQQMATSSAARAAAAASTMTAAALDRPVFPLRLNGFDLVAEIKERSPVEGDLTNAATSRTERASSYADGGAAAISVLTEPDRFDGRLAHLEEVVNAVSEREIPVMRKDFLVDTVQILEAKAAGASGVLLIAAILDDRELANMLDCAFEHNLFVLLESFDTVDLERSAHLLQKVKFRQQAAKQKFLIGVNTRNLRTLSVDPARLRRFAPLLPTNAIGVAESGQRNVEDVSQVAVWGYRMALVGTALMKAKDPGALIAKMLAAGRSAVTAQ
ncbi:MAG: indole-3-glycerol phosphate synthase [Woeseiaceae bacterium]|jgi:indole-3-glycerol phosphate synthase